MLEVPGVAIVIRCNELNSQYDGEAWVNCLHSSVNSMLFTIAWASLAAVFSFSIAMVVWGRNGDGTLNF